MKYTQVKQIRRQRRKIGIRKRIFGTPTQPRLTVYRSLKHIYAQIIDDLSGRTLVSSNTLQASSSGQLPRGSNISAASTVGKLLAEKAKAAGITQVAFDRNGFHYHGRLKALADAAREGGLRF